MALSKYDIKIDLARQRETSHGMLVDMVGCNKRVLDVGCDTGYLGETLNAFGNETQGFELANEPAAEARNKLIRVEVGDLEATNLVDIYGRESFDVVVFGDVLEHLRDPLSVLRQARPLLVRGGSVLISTPNIAHGDVRLALLSGRFRYNKLGILDETHTRFFTRDTLVEFLHDAGFVLADLRRTRAPLFTTEIGVVESDYDPAVVEALRHDDEATTYQFVVRAVPDDATTLETSQMIELDGTRARLTRTEELLNEAREECAELRNQIRALDARISELILAHDAAIEERDRAMSQQVRLTRLQRAVGRFSR